jgi:hypothetical protein
LTAVDLAAVREHETAYDDRSRHRRAVVWSGPEPGKLMKLADRVRASSNVRKPCLHFGMTLRAVPPLGRVGVRGVE